MLMLNWYDCCSKFPIMLFTHLWSSIDFHFYAVKVLLKMVPISVPVKRLHHGEAVAVFAFDFASIE